MNTISLKAFNTIGLVVLAIFLAFIFSMSLSSCKKNPVAAALRTTSIILIPTSGNTINGKAVITENANHSFSVNITLQNTIKDSVMVMHIHNGSIAVPGNIAVPLTSIKGTGAQATGATLNITSGISATGATANLTYDSIIKPSKRYFNIHYSVVQFSKIVANGNIQ